MSVGTHSPIPGYESAKPDLFQKLHALFNPREQVFLWLCRMHGFSSSCVLLAELMRDSAGKPRDLRFLKIEGAFEELTGLKAPESVDRLFSSLVGRIKPPYLDKADRILSEGKSTQFIIRSQNTGKYLKLTAVPTGEDNIIAVAVKDVSHEKNLEEELHQANNALSKTSERLSQALENLAAEQARSKNLSESVALQQGQSLVALQAASLDQSRDLLLASDVQGRLRYCNHGAELLMGMTAREMEGKTLSELLPEVSPPLDSGFLQSVLDKGSWQGELRFDTGIRQGRIWEAKWAVVPAPDGASRILLVLASDVTDRRLLESRFLRAQRMESIGALASGVAHDLNNIFLPISLSLTMLRKGCSEDQKQMLFEMLDDSTKRGAELVGKLLAFGKGMDGLRVEVQPRTLLQEMRRMLSETFPRNIVIECRVVEDLWTIEADSTQMHQVLLNLCVNARDSMPNGGKLTLSGENILFDEHYTAMNPEAQAGPYVVLQVGDTGTGISLEILEKIFDPFFTTKEPGKGTGLGLSTVHGIVKGHRGFVQVRSQVGQGSVFKIYLPAIPSPVPVQEEPAEAEVPLANGELLLVVDDEEAVRESLKHLLEAQGYRVLLASDGSSGMVCFVQQQEKIQALITDIMMPVMDGAELVRAVRRLAPKLPIVAMSGLPEKELAIDHSDSKGTQFLIKPFVSDQLLRILQRSLNGSGTRKAPAETAPLSATHPRNSAP